MLRKIMSVLKHYAWFKRFNAKVTYELLAKNIPATDWHFMNYGYVPDEAEKSIPVPEKISIQKYPLQMYHFLAAKARLEGLQVLEVGSGRGGGARHITSFYKPAYYTAMDLAQSAVDLASRIHVLPNLKFIQGNAESIPVASNSMDVVINVESCHAYGSVEKFLSEVKRVLKPGGHLLLVDFRSDNTIHLFKEQLRNSGLEMLEEQDISKQVITSIELEDVSKTERIRTLIPLKWQKLFSEFAGVVGSRFYLTLKDGSRSYCRFVLRKSA